MASSPGVLTLTTDFGTEGPYVAAMKGIVLSLSPGTQLVDVCHRITPQNVLEGAFVLAAIVDAFASGTVHLVVVDPGVGTDRRLIAAKIADQWFVAPDNGVLSGVLHGREAEEIREITNPAIRRREVSHTFHGRDILAPAAAFLLRGGDPSELGPRRERLITLANFEPREDGDGFVGEVIFRDAFGNLITNVHQSHLDAAPSESWLVEVAGQKIEGLRRTYAEDLPGALIALAGGTGWIELAVVNGDAARRLTAGSGTTVWFKRKLAARRGD
jgi:S-adenosyl-L-methionine hydrolase (adenosine-forming)